MGFHKNRLLQYNSFAFLDKIIFNDRNTYRCDMIGANCNTYSDDQE